MRTSRHHFFMLDNFPSTKKNSNQIPHQLTRLSWLSWSSLSSGVSSSVDRSPTTPADPAAAAATDPGDDGARLVKPRRRSIYNWCCWVAWNTAVIQNLPLSVLLLSSYTAASTSTTSPHSRNYAWDNGDTPCSPSVPQNAVLDPSEPMISCCVVGVFAKQHASATDGYKNLVDCAAFVLLLSAKSKYFVLSFTDCSALCCCNCDLHRTLS